jgi:opacity protein-like surface antigen
MDAFTAERKNGERCRPMAGRPRSGKLRLGWVLVFCAALILAGLARPQRSARAAMVDAGVLEISGNTSFSVDYQKERGGDRETTHLRLTPSIGYFILEGLEVSLRFSYIFDRVYDSPETDDSSRRLLFTLGPVYHFHQMSDIFVPYLGADFGTYYQKFSTRDDSRSNVQFALGLEAGTRILFTENVGMKLGFQYLHGFKEGSIGHTDFVGIEIGLSLFIPTWPAH